MGGIESVFSAELLFSSLSGLLSACDLLAHRLASISHELGGDAFAPGAHLKDRLVGRELVDFG